ncbi:GNAT family N-acetyltransferase [Gaetbulibacter aestuarii]|uniref:GNAT family N-acetyltransferase n=1 Tax=Gaetbulibacter aestuarii TaxID=1502358 RepID=A0ABW7N1E5_9FLAO
MEINIVSYQPQLAKAFYDLNIEWLKHFFYVEAYDEEVLSKPEKYIINKGGHIFFASRKDTILGTAALMPLKGTDAFELTKMGVSPKYRGLQIGQKLMQHCIDFAKNNNMTKLIIYSNTILENAIHIYKKYGFKEIPVEPDVAYERCNIKLELPL